MKWRIVVGMVLMMVGLLVHSAYAYAQEEPVGPPDEEAVTDEAEVDADQGTEGDDEALEEAGTEDEAEDEGGESQDDAAEEGTVEPQPDEAEAVTNKEGVVVLKRSTPESEARGPFTVLGATALHREDTALRIAIGYPEVNVVYHMPWDTDLEFGIGGGFLYGFNANSTADIYGAMVLGEGRWRFFKDGQHSIALVANPSFMMGAGHSDFVSGLTIGFPGIVYDYNIKDQNHAIVGFSIPWGFYVSEVKGEAGFATRIPLILKAGMEFELTDLVHLFITFEMGADIWIGDVPLPDGEGAYLFARGLTGVGVIL